MDFFNSYITTNNSPKNFVSSDWNPARRDSNDQSSLSSIGDSNPKPASDSSNSPNDDITYLNAAELTSGLKRHCCETTTRIRTDGNLKNSFENQQPESELVTGDVHCPICLEKSAGKNSIKNIQCGHAFHAECLNLWITQGRSSCPICRFVLGEKTSKPETRSERSTNTTNQTSQRRRHEPYTLYSYTHHGSPLIQFTYMEK